VNLSLLVPASGLVLPAALFVASGCGVAGLFIAALFLAGLFMAGLFLAGLFLAGLFVAILFVAGLFVTGLFLAGMLAVVLFVAGRFLAVGLTTRAFMNFEAELLLMRPSVSTSNGASTPSLPSCIA